MNHAFIWLAPYADLGNTVGCNEGHQNAGRALDDVCAWMVRKHAIPR